MVVTVGMATAGHLVRWTDPLVRETALRDAVKAELAVCPITTNVQCPRHYMVLR